MISADVGRATHPMGDRVRSGMFASLSSRGVLAGARVLDAFAGTGAIGLEALSRGAESAVFIERDKVAAKVIQHNIDQLGVGDRAKVINTTVANWLGTNDSTDEFDLIFADPPYRNPQFSTVFRLIGSLKSKGLMILSKSDRMCESEPNQGVVVVDDFRSYGEATLVFYRKI